MRHTLFGRLEQDKSALSEFFTIGTLSEDGSVRSDRGRDVLAACNETKNCKVLEVRHYALKDGSDADVVIVEVRSDQVPTRNLVGIKYPERVAFIIPIDRTVQPAVLALRRDFPWTLHQNLVPIGEPRSLCLDDRPWAEQELSWTGKKFVQRVVWWLGRVAKGTIHQQDQALEPPFLGVPSELVISHSLLESEQSTEPVIGHIRKRDSGAMTFRVMPVSSHVKVKAREVKYPLVHVLVVRTPAAIHSVYELGTPSDLAALETCLTAIGVSFRAAFEEMVRDIAWCDGESAAEDYLSVLAAFPRQRSEEAAPERSYYFAFLVEENVGELAVKLGGMERYQGRFVQIIGNGKSQSIDWSSVKLTPLNVIMDVTPESMAQLNGTPNMSGIGGILIGSGMLGSQLLNNWVRSGWVGWETIDREHIQPHNVARHTAEDDDIGKMKAEVVSQCAQKIYPPYSRPSVAAHHIDVTKPNQLEMVQAVISNASVVVDATASVRVSRMLGRNGAIRRAISAFLGPNGESFVLLAEDRERSLRLDMIEPQYWRWVLNDEWGEQHMRKPASAFRYGGGCGDVSATIPNTSGLIAGAVLSEQIRSTTLSDSAAATVWLRSVRDGSVSAKRIALNAARRHGSGRWSVVWDDETIAKARRLRKMVLPNETGGIILGYTDHSAGEIYVVDVIPPPSDSDEGISHFSRGIVGLKKLLDRVQERTAGHVMYLGDWHSHPSGHGVAPSRQDAALLTALRDQRRIAGEPTVMLIVGDEEVQWVVEE